MVGTNRVALAKKCFEKYNGQIYGAETLKQIIISQLASDDKKVVEYLKVLRNVGVLKEVSPFKFLINTEAELLLPDEQVKL